jgi:hypothetical protein
VTAGDDDIKLADVLLKDVLHELRALREEVRRLSGHGGSSTRPGSRLVSASALAEELNVERSWGLRQRGSPGCCPSRRWAKGAPPVRCRPSAQSARGYAGGRRHGCPHGSGNAIQTDPEGWLDPPIASERTERRSRGGQEHRG